MKNTVLIASLLLTLGLTACEKPTTVVNVPPPAEPVAGPAGPSGATGMTGPQGASGATGTQGGTAVIVVTPPASAVQN
ncbi:hypothetical protein LNV09_20345 [Paucibacter sp. B2R-40]|uniref:hypothetical protein n=1 Tax=Paucibacter sp. B2R-40 TaxID=2893554 RepID=UPI0021E3CCE2|nr:hypothetical protein [Paucibacter sp. B2R-40]MCV2356498.1 hypothetical protein [Paucibacter sp. B2R-40]